MDFWDPRQARLSLALFMAIAATGLVKMYLTRPVYPGQALMEDPWPPAGCLVDATVLGNLALEVFPAGTTIARAVRRFGLVVDPLGSGFCLQRAGVLQECRSGWRIRPMTQLERWIWRIPMDIHRAGPGDLSRIEGIGPAMASRIHDFVRREKSLDSLDDLLNVPGIGPSRLKMLKEELALY